MEHIRCEFITPKDFDRVIQFSRETFLNDEPLCHSMGLKVSPGHDYYIRYALEQCNSVMAVDTANGNRIVGLRGHRVAKRGEKSAYNPPEDELWARVMTIGEYAFNRADVWNKYIDIDSMVECKVLTVHRDYRGMGLSLLMMEFTFDFMRREGIPLMYVWVTSRYSKGVMLKLGFQVVDECSYEDYQVEGRPVFRPAAEHKGYAVLVKQIE